MPAPIIRSGSPLKEAKGLSMCAAESWGRRKPRSRDDRAFARSYKMLYDFFAMSRQGGEKPADIEWEGDSKEVLSDFPLDVKIALGFSLRQVQNGEQPRCEHRPMTSVGKGVWELKDADERTWYRLMYLTKIDDVIHVLHCFEKDSRKTDRRDKEIAKAQLQQVQQRLREQRKS